MSQRDSSFDMTTIPQVEPFNSQQVDDTIFAHDDDVPWVRDGVNGATVDATCLDSLENADSDDYD